MLGDILIPLLFLSKFKWRGQFLAQHFPSALSPLFCYSIFVEMLCPMPALWGGTKIPRRWYTPWQKMAALVLIVCYMEEDGVCCAEAARQANIAQKNL